MRAIFLSWFIVSFSISSVAQNKDNGRPTQQQILAQKQQALAKAKKEREVTRIKLADAKASNEDPEKIKHMEKMLATMDQMIVMLENTDLNNNPPKTLPAPEKKEPAYISPFTPIKLSKSEKAPTWSEARDKLLWYRGRMIDANTLITHSGLIVRYDRQGNTIILQPPKQGPTPDTIYYGLVNTLSQINPMKNDYTARMESMLNSFFWFPQIEAAYKEYDLFKERYYELAKNTIKTEAPRPDANIEAKIQNLIDFMENLPPVQITMPPKRPNDLCLCDDETIKQTYKTQMDNWIIEFYSAEKKIAGMIVQIYKHADFIRQTGGSVSIPFTEAEITGYCIKVLERMKEKVEELNRKYESDALVEDGLVLATLNLLKMVENFDVLNSPQYISTRSAIFNLFKEIRSSLESDNFKLYIDTQKRAKNFEKVFDYSLYAAHEFNKKILYGNSNVNTNLFQIWMEDLKKYNRFKLSIQLDFHFQISSETGQVSMWANGLLKEEAPVYVSLGLKDCQWDLFLADVDHRNRETSGEEFKITMKVLSGEKDYLNDKKPPFPYSGPDILKMVFPGFKINFCGGESEAKMDVASYLPDDAKQHENDDVKVMYTMDILGYVNKVLLSLKKTEMNVDQLMNTAGKMMNINNLPPPQSSGNAALDAIRMQYLTNLERYKLQSQLAQISHTERTVVKLTNNSSSADVLFDPEVNIADPNDPDRKMGIMLTKGIIKILITHVPQ